MDVPQRFRAVRRCRVLRQEDRRRSGAGGRCVPGAGDGSGRHRVPAEVALGVQLPQDRQHQQLFAAFGRNRDRHRSERESLYERGQVCGHAQAQSCERSARHQESVWRLGLGLGGQLEKARPDALPARSRPVAGRCRLEDRARRTARWRDIRGGKRAGRWIKGKGRRRVPEPDLGLGPGRAPQVGRRRRLRQRDGNIDGVTAALLPPRAEAS